MKQIRYIIKATLLSAAIACTSCDDWFSIYPESEMVYEDFWADKNDVFSMLGSCYRGMIEPGFMERLIVWGELRSDNIVAGPNLSAGDDLQYLLEANVTSSNGYASWSDFYKVINYCNTLILYAPDVKDKDPNFTQEELDMCLAEAKAVRAFCYFTLVRTFRDVPYITEPYTDDTQNFYTAQTSPDRLVNTLIADLEACVDDANDRFPQLTYTKGRFTKNGIRALIADMALWQGDYQKCVQYCDDVLTDTKNFLALEPYSKYNYNVFIAGNSTESIFELQFIQENIPNYVVNEFYGRSGSGSTRNTYQKLSAYDLCQDNANSLFGETDVRKYDAFFKSGSAAMIPIQKYVAMRTESATGTVRESDYTIVSNSKNWVVYRLSDIYLMKAEALATIGTDLQGALDMVSKTYDRANPTLNAGSLQLSSYNTPDAMRKLVLDERQREFIFEGKRYFDLIRLARYEKSTENIVSNYLLRKYGNLDQSTTKSKLNTMDAIYMPISADELKLNSLLVQNPFYDISSDVTK